MSPSDFAYALSAVFCPGSKENVFLFSGDDSWISMNGETLEIDVSKFDKSQLLTVLLFECALFRLFGMPEEYINLWYDAHYYKFVSDPNSGISFNLTPQRNSGDAWTFGGNTMFLVAVICSCIDVNRTDGINYTPFFDKFRLLLNLEVKQFRYLGNYFCSKFLLPYVDRWFFIPCPIKIAIKLGRTDMVNHQHVEEVRMSLVDLTKEYGDYRISGPLSDAIAERFTLLSFDIYPYLISIYNIVRDKDYFHSLYYEEVGANIRKDRYFHSSQF